MASVHRRPAFVLFGASMVEYSFRPGGWGAAFADLYSRKADILLRGYRGWNTRRAKEALPNFLPKDFPTQPALVVIFFGTNDAAFPLPSGRGQYVPIPEYMDNLRYMCTYCKALSDTTRVVLITPPPVNEEARRKVSRERFGPKAEKYLDRSNDRARTYAQACKSVAEEMGVGLADLYSAITDRPNWETSCLSDGMHLSGEGSGILLELLLNVLKEADWVPPVHWESMPNDVYCKPHKYDMLHPFLESEDYNNLQNGRVKQSPSAGVLQ